MHAAAYFVNYKNFVLDSKKNIKQLEQAVSTVTFTAHFVCYAFVSVLVDEFKHVKFYGSALIHFYCKYICPVAYDRRPFFFFFCKKVVCPYKVYLKVYICPVNYRKI